MSWGAGAGFAQSFLSTLQGLTALERSQMEAAEAKERRDREKATRTAAAETLGRVGQSQEVALSSLTAGSQQQKALAAQTEGMAGEGIPAEDIARKNVEAAQYVTRQGIPSGKLTEPYSEAQAFQDYSRRIAGIDPEKAVTARVQGLQLEKLTREADNARQFNTLRTELNDNLARISGTAESNGLQGLAEEAKKAGLKVEYVAGKNGVGSRVNVLGPKGDVLETISDVGKAVDRLQGLVMQDFETRAVGLLGTPEAVLAQLRGQRKDASEAIKNTATARYYESAAAKLANDVAKDANAQAAIKPFMDRYNALSPEQQNGTAGQKLLNQAAAAAARKTGDFKTAASLTDAGRAEDAYSKAAAEAAKTGMPPPNREEIFAGFGFAPAAVEAAFRSGINPTTKKPWTQAEIAAFKKRYPNTPVDDAESTTPAAAPSGGARPGSAIPVKTSSADKIRAARGLPERIPEPPPKEITRSKGRGGGTIREPNPAYEEWERQYGEKYRAQQR